MSNWQPIETVPKDDTERFLVVLANGFVALGTYNEWTEEIFVSGGDDGWDYTSYPITHWMPLPSPPEPPK